MSNEVVMVISEELVDIEVLGDNEEVGIVTCMSVTEGCLALHLCTATRDHCDMANKNGFNRRTVMTRAIP